MISLIIILRKIISPQKSIIDNAEGSVVILCDKHAFPN